MQVLREFRQLPIALKDESAVITECLFAYVSLLGLLAYFRDIKEK